jgi:hypothetical protein
LPAVSSFAHWAIALLLQAAYSNYQIGAFENFHELVEDILIVLRPGPKVFFQYELRFVNRLKSQLLISHLFFLPIKEMPVRPGKRGKKSSRLLGDIPAFFGLCDQFLFQCGGPRRSARSRRFLVPHAFEVPRHLRTAAASEPARLWRSAARGALRKWGGLRPKSTSSPHERSAKKIFDRAVADKLTISGTHWLMPNVGTLAKDGNSYVFAAEG